MKRYLSVLTTLIVLLSVAISLYARPAAAASDVGYRDFLFGSNCDATPTGEKPESKLWFNDGFWWGSLCAPDNTYHIYKLNLSTQTWQDTGTPLDDRPNSKADILWDKITQKLYIASHVFVTNGAVPTSTSSDWGRLYRYSYNAGTYSLDSGFPVNVTRGIEEALVLAKDSTGTLWVCYVESKKVMINHSAGSDTNWGTPKLLSVATGATNLTNDDIAANIAFDTTTANPKIGVLWSNHTDKKMYFAVHQDSNPNDQAWTSFAVYAPLPSSPDAADDHINIKLQSDGRGVYAVTKTSNSVSSQPLIVLLACTAGCDSASSWQATTVYTKGEHHTRAILLIDTDQNTLNIFSTNSESGGVIYRKSSPISNIAFAPGHGSVFIKSAGDTKINNPTSTKDNVNGTTGLVILAADGTTRHYLHNYDPLGGPPSGPTADFSGTPTSGTAPLAVSFTDLSTGNPTSWSWDFNNDGTPDASIRNPSFIYNTPGAYTVKLTVSNANGSDTKTKTGYITVTSPGAPTADFSGTPTSGTAPLSVAFTDLSTGNPTSWSWDFDNDGTPDASIQNPSFTYNTPGSYTVKLTVANANGSDTKTKTGYITVTNTRIKEITFENGNGSNNLTDPTTGADSTSGTVSLETSAPLDGSFSATIPNVASSYLQENLSAADDIYISFVLRISAKPSSAARIALLSNAGTSVGTLQVLTDGRLQLRDSVANAAVGTSTIALTTGQTYHIGLHQRKGSGSNALLEAYVVAGGGSFGTTPPFASKTTGTWTTPADRLRVGATNTVAVNATFDDIKLDTAILPN